MLSVKLLPACIAPVPRFMYLGSFFEGRREGGREVKSINYFCSKELLCFWSKVHVTYL